MVAGHDGEVSRSRKNWEGGESMIFSKTTFPKMGGYSPAVGTPLVSINSELRFNKNVIIMISLYETTA